MNSTNEQRGTAAVQTLGHPRNLIHCFSLQVYELLPPPQRVFPKDTQGDGGRRAGTSDRRQGCRRQIDWVGEMAAETEAGAEKGGRWRKTRSGARFGEAEGWRTERTGDADTNGKKGRRYDRGQTEWTQPTRLAASVINNRRPMCDKLSAVPAGPGPPICYITATHSKVLRLLIHDVIINHIFSLLLTLYIILHCFVSASLSVCLTR